MAAVILRKKIHYYRIKEGRENSMEKKELLYEGKAKKDYTTEDPDVLIVDY